MLIRAATPTKSARDTGLAMALLALLLYWYTAADALLPVAIILLLLALFCPLIFSPIVKPWLALSDRIAIVMSNVILTALFFLLVTPIGLLRRMAGADPLQLRKWRQGADSVMRRRDHLFGPEDLDKPY